MRTALGAGQGRLSRQLMTESCVLAAIGGLAGIGVTYVAIRALVAASPVTLPTFVQPGVNWSVARVHHGDVRSAAACSLGLAPVLHLRAGKIAERAQGRLARIERRAVAPDADGPRHRPSLGGRGAARRRRSDDPVGPYKLTAIDPGFDPTSVLDAERQCAQGAGRPASQRRSGHAASPADGACAARRAPPLVAPQQLLLDRVRAVPGVAAASIVSDVPLGGGSSAVFYAAEGDTTTGAQTVPRAYMHAITPEFFSTMGITIRSGRSFEPGEMRPDSNVVVVSANVAQRFWAGQDPIGKRIKLGNAESTAPWLTIVGVVDELKYRGLPQNPTADPDLYLSAQSNGPRNRWSSARVCRRIRSLPASARRSSNCIHRS